MHLLIFACIFLYEMRPVRGRVQPARQILRKAGGALGHTELLLRD